MIKDIWFNLPVKNIEKSKEFFSKLGFTFNPEFGNSDNSACLMLGEQKVVVMLFDEASFKGFTNADILDTTKGTEVLLSIGTESKEEVDMLAEKAVEAGGTTNHKPYEMDGWMYGCIFSDLDGHKWNVMYMDMSQFS